MTLSDLRKALAGKPATEEAQAVARRIHHATHGLTPGRCTMRDARAWAQGMLPPGQGYPQQDITPALEQIVTLLRS